jgi:2',3'-cyclic-nucleotide 2'-phosphodiesterase (5'-nucleotidase family)
MDNLFPPGDAMEQGANGTVGRPDRPKIGVLAPLFLTLFVVGCAQVGGARAGRSPAGPAPTGPDLPPASETGTFVVQEAPVSFTVLSDSLPADPEVEGLVAPFRASMADHISEIIGEATGLFTEGRPEGSLGNFAADAVLEAARARSADPVHMSLVNNGGLRVPIAQGPITVGEMFELMPFENLISILVLDGSTVQELAHQLAARGGEPVAGFSFRIVETAGAWEAVDLQVGGEPLVPDRLYRLATSDFLASAGDDLSALLSAKTREDLPVLIRDAFIEYVRNRGSIEPRVEGRVTGGRDG